MKTLLLSLVCAAGLTATAQAQLFRPQTASNVLLGGVAGAIIGEHNNHHAAEGAAIGAAAGYLWSVATTPPRQPAYAPPVPVVSGYYRSTAIIQPPCGYVTAAPTVVTCAPTVVYRRQPHRVVYVAPAPLFLGPRYYVSSGYRYNNHHRGWR
jgi:opacity protein-like surface antigen